MRRRPNWRALETRLTEIRSEAETARTALADDLASRDRVRAETTALDAELAERTESATELAARIEARNAELADLDLRIATRTASEAALTTRIADAEAQLAALLETGEQAASAPQLELARLQEELETVRAELAIAEVGLASRQAALQDANADPAPTPDSPAEFAAPDPATPQTGRRSPQAVSAVVAAAPGLAGAGA